MDRDEDDSAMDRRAFVRGAGAAAIAGGILRGATTFLPATQTLATHLTYLTVDVLLLLAVAGLFALQRKRAGRWGTVGALVAMLGAGLLISDDLFSPTFALYPIAAVIFALGLGALALVALRARTLPRWISAIWLTAIVGGALGLGLAPLHILFTLAGLLIAVGFVGVGAVLSSAPNRMLDKEAAGEHRRAGETGPQGECNEAPLWIRGSQKGVPPEDASARFRLSSYLGPRRRISRISRPHGLQARIDSPGAPRPPAAPHPPL